MLHYSQTTGHDVGGKTWQYRKKNVEPLAIHDFFFSLDVSFFARNKLSLTF